MQGVKDLVCSEHQAAVLLQFNRVDTLTYGQLLERTRIGRSTTFIARCGASGCPCQAYIASAVSSCSIDIVLCFYYGRRKAIAARGVDDVLGQITRAGQGSQGKK